MFQLEKGRPAQVPPVPNDIRYRSSDWVIAGRLTEDLRNQSVRAPVVGDSVESNPFKVSVGENGAPQVGPLKISTCENGTPQVGALEIGVDTYSVGENSEPQVSASEMGALNMRSLENSKLKVCPLKIGPFKPSATQVGTLEEGKGKVGTLKDKRAVFCPRGVLQVFGASDSHGLTFSRHFVGVKSG
jgi:hypothetical protein